jgi:stage V sporulation protein B
VSGVVYPVLFFPAAILTSLSIVIVPALTKAYVRRNRQRILSLTRRLLRLVIWFSAAVAMFLHTFAEQMAAVLFHDGSYGAAIALFVPLIPLAYLDLIVDSVLRSIDRQILATICAVADASLSLVLVWLLVPRYGVAGLAASVLSAKLLNLSLSLLQLENGLSLHLRPLRTAVVPFFLAKLCAVFASSVPVGEISDAAELFLRGVLFAAPFLAGFWLTGRRDPSEQQKPKARRGRFFTKQKKSLGKRSQGSSCVT